MYAALDVVVAAFSVGDNGCGWLQLARAAMMRKLIPSQFPLKPCEAHYFLGCLSHSKKNEMKKERKKKGGEVVCGKVPWECLGLVFEMRNAHFKQFLKY